MYIFAYGNPQNWRMEKTRTVEDEETVQCDSRSSTEKCLITFLILLTCVLVALWSFLIIFNVADKCVSMECVKQAAWLKNVLSKDISPCEDFYKFVCPVPTDNTIEKAFERMKEVVEKQIEDLLKASQQKNENALTKMHRACFNVGNAQKYLSEIMAAVMKWGLFQNDTKQFNWIKFIQTAREHGLGYDLFFNVAVVESAAGEPVLRIGPTKVPSTFLLKFPSNNDTFIESLEEIAEMGAKSDIKELMTMKKFEKLYDFPLWTILPNQSGILDYENYTVLVAAPDYFSELLDILSATDDKTVANFMQRYVLESISDQYIQWSYFQYRDCAKSTAQHLPHLVELAYVTKYLPEESLSEAKLIATSLKNELILILRNAQWLNGSTKKYILDKITNTKFVIGLPKGFFQKETEYLSETQSIEDFDDDNFLLMLLNAQKYKYIRQISTLQRDKYILQELSDTILSVYPFYSFKHNLIVIPAAVLQNPIFHPKRPKYLNYGLLGAVIGRELMRAFLRFAQESDEECLDVDWSSLLQQIQCLEEQYSSYNYTDVLGNNNTSIKGEQILVDVAGTKLAYMAYRKRVEMYEVDRPLFGFNFTTNQLFWIAKGLHGCYFLETFSKNNPSLSYMVMSSLINLKAFRDDFKCLKKNVFSIIQQCNVL